MSNRTTCPCCGARVWVYEYGWAPRDGWHFKGIAIVPHNCPAGGDHMILQRPGNVYHLRDQLLAA